jgi:outer membrane protein assembly factor BamB
MRGHDLNHTGYSASTAPNTNRTICIYTTGEVVSSSPAVTDGKVYIGSGDYKVYCLNASTGTQIWKCTTGGYVFSSPAVADGKVYVGSANAKVHAFASTVAR